VVDNRDYAVWRQTYGQTDSSPDADGNGDGAVDAGDYIVWRANVGRSQSDSTQTGVMTIASASVAPLESAGLSLSNDDQTIGYRAPASASTFDVSEPMSVSSSNVTAIAFESLLARPRHSTPHAIISGRSVAGGDQWSALDQLMGQISSWRSNEDLECHDQQAFHKSATQDDEVGSEAALEIALGSFNEPV
jgi:hypothetical protein